MRESKFEIAMTTMISLPVCLFFTFLSMPVHAYVGINPIVNCMNITLNGSSTFQACAIGLVTGPSPAQFENGTTIYVGGYSNMYQIVQGLEQGFDIVNLTQAELSNAKTGIEVNVARDDYDVCTVSITTEKNGTNDKCVSCTYCGNETYTADCTNIENGRIVDCESTSNGMVYFPLTEAALKGYMNATNTTDVPPMAEEVPSLSNVPSSTPMENDLGNGVIIGKGEIPKGTLIGSTPISSGSKKGGGGSSKKGRGGAGGPKGFTTQKEEVSSASSVTETAALTGITLFATYALA
jgi:hypothetical protein